MGFFSGVAAPFFGDFGYVPNLRECDPNHVAKMLLLLPSYDFVRRFYFWYGAFYVNSKMGKLLIGLQEVEKVLYESDMKKFPMLAKKLLITNLDVL